MTKQAVLLLALVVAGVAPAIAAIDATIPRDLDAASPSSFVTDDSMLALLDSIPTQSAYQCIYVRNDTVFCALQGFEMHYRNRLTGATINTFPLQGSDYVIAICPFGDSVCVSRLSNPEKCEVYTLNGTYVRTFQPSGGQQVRGLDWDGTHFWATHYTGSELEIYLMTPTGTVTKTMTRSGGIQSNIARDLVIDRMYPNRLWTSPNTTGPHSVIYVAFDTSANTFTPLVEFPTGLSQYMAGLGWRDDQIDGSQLYVSCFFKSNIFRYKVHDPVQTQGRYLICWSDHLQPDSTIGVRLEALGDSVEYMDVRNYTPTLGELTPYDAVLPYSNWPYDDSAAFGNVLADYCDAGGGVVLGHWSFSTGWGMGGRIMTGNYATISRGANTHANTTLGWYNPAHPIMDGVSSVGEYFAGGSNFITTDSVARWADGRPYVGVSANQKVVGVNSYPGVNSQPGRTGDWALVFHNALAFVAGMTGVGEGPGRVPLGLELFAGPNPANRQVHISYSAEVPVAAMVGIYDANGRLVRTLDTGRTAGETRRATWDLSDEGGRPVARGIYFCRLAAGASSLSRKLVVQR